ncbi:hypothetical protein JIG36_04085 [Actinoplanes sp. LDG1-06]|uniref:Heme-binding protein n=1 Tax=Paractinoplanes ovalisporus TaxID=2810368 RepID=A0ABS2A4H1_9ACTN|nr:hypothetical protein [Actinoplanes ovalisporus]
MIHNAAGEVIGVSGGTSDVDEACAQAGLSGSPSD